MNPKLEEIFNEANAEFWLQLDDGMSERFGEMVREYLEDSSTEVAFVIKDYKRWKKNNGGK